jgi:hypothetical protein
MGMTHIVLAAAHKDVLAGALLTAWRLCVEKLKNRSHKSQAPTKRARAKIPYRKKQ